MLCEICKSQFDTYRKLARHIKDYHEMTTKQYFDKYLATSQNNHICVVCGNETKFINLHLGYHITCSHKCHTILQNRSYSEDELECINNKRKNTWNKKDLSEYKELQSNIQSERWKNYSDDERQLFIQKQKEGFLNMSADKKKEQHKKSSKTWKENREKLTEEQLLEIGKKISDSLKTYYNNMSNEEREIFKKSFRNRMNNLSDEQKLLMRKHHSEAMRNKSKEDWDIILQKIYQTKRKNGTFTTSKPEDNCYNLLLTKFSTVNRNYKSIVYPYLCDFYIPELDLYIECHFHWTHGKAPYIGSKEDLEIIEQYKNKHTKYYNIAIYVWSILDVKKLKIAKENNLNYLAFYTEQDFISWFNTL